MLCTCSRDEENLIELAYGHLQNDQKAIGKNYNVLPCIDMTWIFFPIWAVEGARFYVP